MELLAQFRVLKDEKDGSIKVFDYFGAEAPEIIREAIIKFFKE